MPHRRYRPSYRESLAIWSYRDQRCWHPACLLTHRFACSARVFSAVSVRVRADPGGCDLARTGASVRSIAATLRRSASTISRELRRGADPDNGRYRPHPAKRMAEQCRAWPRASKVDSDTLLHEQIISRLALEWSPEQISRTLSLEFPADCRMHVATETIYQALYRYGGNLHRQARKGCLRKGRHRRYRRKQPGQRRARFTGASIHDRPAEATNRVQAGHWEGDLIVGAGNRSAIATLYRLVDAVYEKRSIAVSSNLHPASMSSCPRP